MKAKIRVHEGCVELHDEEIGSTLVAMTAVEAAWLSFFLQQHVTSELIVQLRLASIHLQDEGEDKDFPLKRS